MDTSITEDFRPSLHSLTIRPLDPQLMEVKRKQINSCGLTKKSTVPFIGYYLSPCHSTAAHINNSSIKAIHENDVAMMSYRMIQARKGKKMAISSILLAGSGIAYNILNLSWLSLVPVPELVLNMQNYYWYSAVEHEILDILKRQLPQSALDRIEALPNSYKGRVDLIRILKENDISVESLEKKIGIKTY